jgi:hypothetical protein
MGSSVSNQESILNKSQDGTMTKAVENYTAKVPQIAYLSLAVGSMILSASVAMFSKKTSVANFIGLWAPSLLLIGIYNKLVKLEGNEKLNL